MSPLIQQFNICKIMDSSTALSKNQRIYLGLTVIILVDVIWVSSSALTKYLYQHETFEKPFFCAYIKTGMFTLYLFGYLFWPVWKEDYCIRPHNYVYLEQEQDDSGLDEARLSTPTYVPVKVSDKDKSSGTESDSDTVRSVRFSKLAEVRQLSELDAADALLARLSYQATLKATVVGRTNAAKLPVQYVIKLAFVFCLLWFVASYTYQVALSKTEARTVNILSSSSTFFTLMLASLCPASNGDKFTISKMFAILVIFIGIGLIGCNDLKELHIPEGTVLCLVSAFFYSVFLVSLKKIVPDEEKIDISKFLGFLGLFNLLLLWPVFLYLHISKVEPFEWPTREQLTILFLNGLMGTVILQTLMLWACFLTSPLITMTGFSMTIPMTLIADVILKHTKLSSLFYFGVILMILGFLLVTICCHWDNWDPMLSIIRCFYSKLCNKAMALRTSYGESKTSEQTESLIGPTSDCD
ncbi:solute carrier family 35 member F5 [Anthonomus grandis grandis]|uniref:solute carrier family 35 member F5 n=1 Tax=Anthonomus grandis grandis TaxID=2921223 RepID=UPI0021659473|nr:solute carrier family 35 member F5 [Anthonomus grandis grandis]